MSYCRNPQYIYPRDEGIWFNGKLISDDEINTFVYVLLFKNRRSELKERLIKEGAFIPYIETSPSAYKKKPKKKKY